VEKDLPIEDINVSIAAATTSYSRVRIWKLMDAIKQRGGEVFMCDTDSVITDCDLSKHIGLMAEFIPDYKSDDPGAELGSLKCECSDDVKKALKNAKYTPIEIDTALNEMRGGDSTYKVSWRPIAFDAVILSGLKLYTLRKSLPTGEIFCSAAGFSTSWGTIREKRHNLPHPGVHQTLPEVTCTIGGVVATLDPEVTFVPAVGAPLG
jgi:hypothetical protein